MTILHSGATKKYSDNWDNVFGGKRGTKKKSAPAKKTSRATKKKGAAIKKKRTTGKKRK